MDTYILTGMGIGIAVVLILMLVFKRRNNAPLRNDMMAIKFLSGNEEIKFKIRDYLAKNKKIEAIKYVREKTGAGLLESKNFVELMEQQGLVNAFTNMNLTNQSGEDTVSGLNIIQDREFGDKIIKLLKERNKIEAIKMVAETGKLRLIDAKNIVEKIEEKLNNKI